MSCNSASLRGQYLFSFTQGPVATQGLATMDTSTETSLLASRASRICCNHLDDGSRRRPLAP